jgi:hypothetical protein
MRGQLLYGAVRPEIATGAIVLDDAGHGVLGADCEDELECGMVARVRCGNQRQTAGEAEAGHAYRPAGPGGEPGYGAADGLERLPTDAVVLDVGQLGREHLDATACDGGGEAHQAGLIDAEVVHAMEDNHRGSICSIGRPIQTRTHLLRG